MQDESHWLVKALRQDKIIASSIPEIHTLAYATANHRKGLEPTSGVSRTVQISGSMDFTF